MQPETYKETKTINTQPMSTSKHPKGPYLRHQHRRTFQLLWHAGHLHSVLNASAAVRQGARRFHLRQLHRAGLPHPAHRRVHCRQILGYPSFCFLGSHDDGRRTVPDVLQRFHAGYRSTVALVDVWRPYFVCFRLQK